MANFQFKFLILNLIIISAVIAGGFLVFKIFGNRGVPQDLALAGLSQPVTQQNQNHF